MEPQNTICNPVSGCTHHSTYHCKCKECCYEYGKCRCQEVVQIFRNYFVKFLLDKCKDCCRCKYRKYSSLISNFLNCQRSDMPYRNRSLCNGCTIRICIQKITGYHDHSHNCSKIRIATEHLCC